MNNKPIDQMGINYLGYPNISSGIEPISLPSDPSSSQESKRDFTKVLPTILIRKIFVEARKIIFVEAREKKINIFVEAIAALARVNKLCRKVAFSEELFNEINASHCVNAKDWKECFGDLRKVIPSLPTRAELDLEPGDLYKEEDATKRAVYLDDLANSMQTLIPTSIVVKDENGQDKEIVLDSGDAVKELLRYQKAGNRICFDPHSNQRAMAEKRSLAEKPYWVRINKKVIGRMMTYDEQQAHVEEKNLKSIKAKMSDFMDTMVSALMNYIKTGENCFEWDLDKWNKKDSFIRVNDTTGEWHLAVSFSFAGFHVVPYSIISGRSLGVVVSRKSIGS